MRKLFIILISAVLALNSITAYAEGSNILVVYFSCTGTTEAAAENIRTALDCDIYEIVPQEPYTSEDLDYNNDNCRANLEQNDDSARPAISGSIENIGQYDAVFVGYPIWWGKLPKIIYTFFDTYDLSGYTIVPFCTSGGSGISTSVREIKTLEPDANVLDGRRLNGSTAASVKEWTDTLALPTPRPAETPEPTAAPIQEPNVSVDGDTVTVSNPPENSSLIMAFYLNDVLVDVTIKDAENGMTENIKNIDSDTFKAFLWDMETLQPLCQCSD